MPYPDKLLADDEEVVAHLHPHGAALVWPVVRLLAVVGAASYLAALVPVGRQQGLLRAVLLAVVLVVVAVAVVRPLVRWRTTHYVLTTHRLLLRHGVLSRIGRDLPLSRVADVASRQTPWQRLLGSGTLAVESAGDGGALVLDRVPAVGEVQALLAQLVEEDADRVDGDQPDDGWADDEWANGGWADDDGPDDARPGGTRALGRRGSRR